MSPTMAIEDYLAQGGVLSSPSNVPARYRGELLRLMASFVDSELAGSAGFASLINDAPGLAERIAAARIVQEKADHAAQVLALMGDFGADTQRYATHHPWASRVARNADIGTVRQGGDMRLAVFHYPLTGWVDAVTMNLLMGRAGVIQLGELARVSYQPLAEAFRAILPREKKHADLAEEGMKRIVANEEGLIAAQASIDYWRPRVVETFGAAGSARYATLERLGLRHRPNEILLAQWESEIASQLDALGLS